MGKKIKKKKITVDFLFSFPPPTIPENLTMIRRNRVKFLSLSFSWISCKYTSTADRWCSTYPLIRHTCNYIYNATKIITNSLNWNGRAGGMASVIYGSYIVYGKARRWSGVNQVHRSTWQMLWFFFFYYYYFLSVDDNLFYARMNSHIHAPSLRTPSLLLYTFYKYIYN